MSQHLQYKHSHLSPKERRVLCARAKVAPGRGSRKERPATAQQPTILSVMALPQEELGDEESDVVVLESEEEVDDITEEGIEESDLVTEVSVEVHKSEGDDSVPEEGTAELATDHPFLVDLYEYLKSRHGKGRSQREAKQIVSEVARYLHFCNPKLDPTNLYNPVKLDHYMRKLERDRKKATTQHSILYRVRQGLTYIILKLDSCETIKAQKCLSLVGNWIVSLGKEARRMKRVQLEDMANKGAASMSGIEQFCRSTEMIGELDIAVQRSKEGKNIPATGVRRLTVWLAGCILHTNAQRPGAITNAKVSEFTNSTVTVHGRDTYTTSYVENHKTGVSGRAKLTMNQHLTKLMKKYITHIRPHSQGKDSDVLFPNRDGLPIDHLSRHVLAIAKKLSIDLPLNATITRHAAATNISEATQEERTAVATAMSHSQRTQQLYYSLKKGTNEAVQGYRLMETMRSEVETKGKRHTFSIEDTEIIKSLFDGHIACKKPPTIDECRQFLEQHPILKDAKKIRDKVRNIMGR